MTRARTRRLVVVLAVAPLVAACAGAQARERIVGLPCEGCETVFDGLPATIQSIPSSAVLAGAGEPGDRMLLTGTVRDGAGRAVAGTIVYAYHTDARGLYRADASLRGRGALRHGVLRGWARTDASGRYAFTTIRPAPYPSRDLPAHVHLHIIEPGRCTYWIDDVLFTDDPLLTPAQRRALATGRGGDGIVTPLRDGPAAWRVTRDIVLGANVPGYAQCASPRR